MIFPVRSALLVLALLAPRAGGAAPPDSTGAAADSAWRAWDGEIDSGRVRLERWVEPRVDSLCRSLADFNRREITRLDSLYCAGRFGAPGTDPAMRAARAAFRVVARNSFDYIAEIADDDSRVRETDGRELVRPFDVSYVNMGAFPVTALRRALVGRGRFRMEYDLKPGLSAVEETMVDSPTRIRVEKADDGRLRLCMGYPSGANGTLEMLFDPIYRGEVERRTVVDRGDTLDLVVVRNIEGSAVRKWGLHRMGGLAAWRSRPGAPVRVGAAAYFPRMHLRLPLFLPDLGLDDLREFHVPRPIWDRAFVHERRAPAWLGLDPTGAIDDWESEGETPRVLDEIFPDL
jgi:hypothetical protein